MAEQIQQAIQQRDERILQLEQELQQIHAERALNEGHDASKTREEHLAGFMRIISDMAWIIQPNGSLDIEITCPSTYPQMMTISLPSVLHLFPSCVIAWPGGRSEPVTTHMTHFNLSFYLPPTWSPFVVDMAQYSGINSSLSIHDSLVIDPHYRIHLQTLPPIPDFHRSHFLWYGWIVVIVILVLVIGLYFIRKYFVNTRRSSDPQIPNIVIPPLHPSLPVPSDTTTT